MDIIVNDINKSCFNCGLRDGRYCEGFDMELKLADVENNILRFDIAYCDMHQNRNLIND